MFRIRLSDEDRERIGCDEWLDLDLAVLPTEEAEVVEEATGQTYGVLYDDGVKGAKARAWLALHRAGVEVDFATLRFNLAGTTVQRPEGKDESSSDDATSTPPTSASSTD